MIFTKEEKTIKDLCAFISSIEIMHNLEEEEKNIWQKICEHCPIILCNKRNKK